VKLAVVSTAFALPKESVPRPENFDQVVVKVGGAGRLSSLLFLSSSLRELVAVTEVEGVKVGIGALGPVFQELAGRYASVVDKELNR
jgi:hypothetical protein